MGGLFMDDKEKEVIVEQSDLTPEMEEELSNGKGEEE
jgi:hypothetical protein